LRRPVFVTDLGGGGWDLSAYVSTDRWFRGHLHISEYSRKNAAHPPGTSTRVIFGGVDTDKFSPPANSARERAVLFVGRFVPHKGVDVLVRAVDPGTATWLAGTEGSPRYLDDLQALAAGKRVEFLRGLDDDAVIDRYRRASVLVLPSVYRTMYGDETRVPELLGQTLLEAMACETPVICSDVASMPEIVDDGVTGFVVPPNDPSALASRLSHLLDDPEGARQMGRRARAVVLNRFSWRAVVDRCFAAYTGAR
jgi:glycosyltransferase involved in cell wall biosynthesis